MNVGSLQLPHGLLLAPMAGFSDHALRTVCRMAGADYTVTEMVSAKALCYHDRKTPPLARIRPGETPCAIQLFGREPDVLAEAARIVAGGMQGGEPPAAIDINMGCPVPKIAGNGEGSALLRDPALAAALVRAVVRAVPLPVTVKLRLGWDNAHRNAPEVARACEDAGASMICVHGRTRPEMYAGTVDRAGIAAVKAAVRIPVVANGDITDAASALSMLRETGCDGCMIGRAAVGNPFLFTEIAAALEGRPYTPPTPAERLRMALYQLDLAIADKGEQSAVREARRQLAPCFHGMPGAAAARRTLCLAETAEQVRQCLTEALTPLAL